MSVLHLALCGDRKFTWRGKIQNWIICVLCLHNNSGAARMVDLNALVILGDKESCRSELWLFLNCVKHKSPQTSILCKLLTLTLYKAHVTITSSIESLGIRTCLEVSLLAVHQLNWSSTSPFLVMQRHRKMISMCSLKSSS